MRYKLLAALVFISCGLQAQQVNPVPDYVFANRMSVGRNAVTDTLAYFSIGPRYGAIRGFMPPMVVDTALVTGGTKRNGLTIFSIQKNKYVYWDSAGSKWAEMAGTGGPAITGTGVAGYMPEFTTATNLDSTTLYHSAGRFSIGSTTVSNGRFSVFGGQSYFDTSLKVGSQAFLADEGKNEVYVNTTTDAGAYALQVAGSIYNTTGAVFAATSGNVTIGATTSPSFSWSGTGQMNIESNIYASSGIMSHSNTSGNYSFWNIGKSRGTLTSPSAVASGETIGDINYVGHDGASYQLAATIRTVIGGTVSSGVVPGDIQFLTENTSGTYALRAIITADGNLGIGTTSPSERLHVNGNILTADPSGGTKKPWKLGEAATVSPTSPNRTIRVEIDGTVYYIHAKTTND